MAQVKQHPEQNLEQIKKKVKRQRSMIALLSGTIFIFALMYIL